MIKFLLNTRILFYVDIQNKYKSKKGKTIQKKHLGLEKGGLMENISKELDNIIELFKKDYLNLDESLTELRVADDKWTLKEIIGHLIDSASNNHQRFVRLKLSREIEFPDYNNSEWLQSQSHNNMRFSELLLLFFYYNKLIVHIILNIDDKILNNRWNVAWDEDLSFITLEKLANHYVEHMKIHMLHFKERLNEIEKLKTAN